MRAKTLYTFLTKNDKIVKEQYKRKRGYTFRWDKFWESDQEIFGEN